MNNYQEFIYKRTYSRWIPELQRRETWNETINRYRTYIEEYIPEKLLPEFREAVSLIHSLDIMPSMRLLWTAGEAHRIDNISGYNCYYTHITKPKDFADILYILMNGTGVGYSVERQYINQLPTVADTFTETSYTIVFEDSKQGWAEGFDRFINHLYAGLIPKYDVSKIRPRGEILKTFGGKSSGPYPLIELLEFTKKTMLNASGRKLNSLEVYDIVCKIMDIVVVGGVRRSAGISFSNLSDQRMKHAKDGEYWIHNPHRALSNNSVAYTEKPDMNTFMEEWINLMKSGTGERGILNCEGLGDMRFNP